MEKRRRLSQKELYYTKRALFRRLSELYEEDETITEETIVIHRLLNRLISEKRGAPPNTKLTKNSLLDFLNDNIELL
jgi:hypothetical protein